MNSLCIPTPAAPQQPAKSTDDLAQKSYTKSENKYDRRTNGISFDLVQENHTKTVRRHEDHMSGIFFDKDNSSEQESHTEIANKYDSRMNGSSSYKKL